MRLRRTLAVLPAGLLLAALAGALPAAGTPSAPPTSEAAKVQASQDAKAVATAGDGSACVTLAKRSTAGAWVCRGDALSYEDAHGKQVTKKVPGAKTVVTDLRTSAAGRRKAGPATSSVVARRAVGDDWDSWCEPTGQCVRVMTDYIAEIKSNDYYGIGGETYGSFDEIWRQSFSAMKNRYRIALIWDLGYEVEPATFHADVRYYKLGPDGFAGEADLFPGRISAFGQEAIYPGRKTFTTVSKNAHNRTTTHHDDLEGKFYAADRVWFTAVAHLPSFKCPKGQCRYH